MYNYLKSILETPEVLPKPIKAVYPRVYFVIDRHYSVLEPPFPLHFLDPQSPLQLNHVPTPHFLRPVNVTLGINLTELPRAFG
jgi:hypothetical protein